MSNEQHNSGHNPQREPWRERFDDLKEPYVLGALTESERREFEGYLEAHPELQAEVDELGSVANLLALAPQEYEPPPELRRNLLSRIGGATDTVLTESASGRGGLRRLFGLGWLAPATAAAVAVLAIGLFVWNVSLRGENEDLRGELLAQRTYEMRGTGAAQNVRGEVMEVDDGQAVLMAENLPPAPEGYVYKAWLLRDGAPKPAGVFQSHDGVAAMPIEGSIEGADAVAVTEEQEQDKDSPTPKSEPLMTAEL